MILLSWQIQAHWATQRVQYAMSNADGTKNISFLLQFHVLSRAVDGVEYYKKYPYLQVLTIPFEGLVEGWLLDSKSESKRTMFENTEYSSCSM